MRLVLSIQTSAPSSGLPVMRLSWTTPRSTPDGPGLCAAAKGANKANPRPPKRIKRIVLTILPRCSASLKPWTVWLQAVDLTQTMRLVSPALEQLLWIHLRGVFADHQPARPARPPRRGEERKGAAPAWQPAKAGRVYAGVHHDAQETELRAAQSRPCQADEWIRSDGIHPR